MIGHQAYVEWMGTQVLTLQDLWPETPRAAIVGINPAPPSVERGHYYQGRLGRQLWTRLASVGIMRPGARYEDDRAVAAGVGLTDLVKRPTRSAREVSTEELAHGSRVVIDELERRSVPLAVFAFKQSAETALGRRIVGNGFVADRLGPSSVFVMPGPYESANSRDAALEDLRAYWLG